jgi:glycosyltransferase involved in cell wall biosynthesis
MRIWLITVGEPLTLDGHSVRLLRTGILANVLLEQGHEVVWWTSTFAHHKKRHRFHRDTFLETGPRFRTILLHSLAYRRNISLARILNHRGVARKFSRYAVSETPPDLILSSWPTMELSTAAIRYGRRVGVPVLIDVRDLWPDIFLDAVPSRVRWAGHMALSGLVRETHAALAGAAGILAMSEGCLGWGLRYARRDRGPCDAVFPLAYQKPAVSPAELQAATAALHARGVDPAKLICWFIGTFGKTYDVATVIRAARELESQGSRDIQFVLSGDGDQRADLEELARGLSNVAFTGWIDGPQIAAMMRLAGIGLAAVNGVPGTLPNKLFEYLSAGLPVLSSIPGEAADLLERHRCGLTYAPKDLEGFLRTLRSLIDDAPRRRQMSAKALEAFEVQYSAEIVYPRMARFLTDIVRLPPGDAPAPARDEALLATRR